MSINPTRQTIHSEEMKQKIIQTAEKLFNEYGYDNTSVKDIAAAVGVTTGSLYHHFENKEAILMAVFLSRKFLSPELLERYASTEDPETDLKDLLCHVMVDQVLSDGLEFTRFRLAKFFRFDRQSRLEACVRVLVQKCVQKGVFTQDLPEEEIADFLSSVYRGAVYQYSVSREPVDLAGLVERRYEIAIRAVKVQKG